MKVGERWFRSGGEGWYPGLYEWFFSNTQRGTALRAREEEIVYDMLADALRSGHSVVEFGSGTGNYTVPVARRCAGVVAVEVSEAMNGYLRERLLREGLSNVGVRLGRVEDGVGTAESFDGALAMGPFFYVRDLEEGLRALAAALRPGGWTVFGVPLLTPEGRFFAMNELAARRRVYLRSSGETMRSVEEAGLEVQRSGIAGTSRKGLTLVVQARVSSPDGDNGTYSGAVAGRL
ncbi:MAG: class I SAM-dependent methyltransferase [Actinomycetota bacterium]|nr:class I SAM-dependent methyltransferase [Actinomycetota bacterium]